MRNINLNITDRPKRAASRKASQKIPDKNQENTNAKLKLIIGCDKKRRSSEISPSQVHVRRKRAAFGDITNAIQAHSERLALARKKKEETSKKLETSKAAITSRPKRNPSRKAKVEPKKKEPKIEIPEIATELISSSNENKSSNKTDCLNSSQISSQSDRVLNISVSSNSGKSSHNTSLNSSLNTSVRPVPKIPDDILKEYTSPREKTPAPKLRPYDTDPDPINVCEYAESVFQNMKKREALFPVSNYLKVPNTSTTGPMRAILVDWLVEVQENFELYHETLYLAVKIVDNYLQKYKTPKELLQLVGATSLLIASKIEEYRPPPIDDFKYICDDAYSHKQFVEMEIKIFKALNFDINIPVPYRFLRRYAKVNGLSLQILTLARYILELSIHEALFVNVPASKIAAACLCLALKMKDEGEWDGNFVHHTTYKEKDLKQLMRDLNNMVEAAPKNKLQTVRTKYSHPVFHEVAKIPALDAVLL